MKIKYIIPALMLLAWSCDEQVEFSNSNLSGEWHASAFESEIPNMPPEYKEAGEKEFLSSVYTLNEDNSMEMHSDYFKDGAFGNWFFDPNIKEISMAYRYDTTEGIEKYNVTYLSKKKMILRQDIDANEFKGYVQLTLEK